jgi:8-amino-7-oxononanoate synthase
MASFPHHLGSKLDKVKEANLFRSLKTSYPAIDFSSNDYLGFSTKGLLQEEINKLHGTHKVGATGSRLISGNSSVYNELEKEIAQFHSTESALIYNSGYTANIGLLSAVLQKGDLIITDELIHASLYDGIRLSYATHYKFKHNDVNDLKALIERHAGKFSTIYVVVESVYSMDGDCAPLKEIVDLCEQFNVFIIVDEAHGIGVFGSQGRGLCQELHIESKCFARIYTYGKAMGCHGAAIVGSEQLRDYLINFSRSFIYTTGLTEHSLLAIKAAYQLLCTTNQIDMLRKNVNYFNSLFHNHQGFIKSNSAIHCCVVSGNKEVQELEKFLQENQLFVKAVKSPTVKAGLERIRICLHSFNTKEEIDLLHSKLISF